MLSNFRSYNSTYATSPAAAVFNAAAAVQTQPTPHTPALGAVGATNPSSVYARYLLIFARYLIFLS